MVGKLQVSKQAWRKTTILVKNRKQREINLHYASVKYLKTTLSLLALWDCVSVRQDQDSERNWEIYSEDGHNYSATSKTILNEKLVGAKTYSENALHEVWAHLLIISPDLSLTMPTWQISKFAICTLPEVSEKLIILQNSVFADWMTTLSGALTVLQCPSVLGLGGKWNAHQRALRYRQRRAANWWRWAMEREKSNLLQTGASSYWAEVFKKERRIRKSAGKTETDNLCPNRSQTVTCGLRD